MIRLNWIMFRMQVWKCEYAVAVFLDASPSGWWMQSLRRRLCSIAESLGFEVE